MNRRETIIALRKSGLTIRAIQKKLKLSSTSLVQYYLDKEKEPLMKLTKVRLVSIVRKMEEALQEIDRQSLEEGRTETADPPYYLNRFMNLGATARLALSFRNEG